MSSIWLEQSHWTVFLYPFMRQTQIGRRTGMYVYYIHQEDRCIYVGQTYNGVRLRLWQHVSQSSRLGEWLVKNELVEPSPICGVIKVNDCGGLDMAERYYISLFNPQENIVRYKTTITLPPTKRAQIKHIEIQEPTWAAQYGAITGLKGGYTPYQPSPVQTPPQAPIMPATDPMAGLYERAYRDPNHPDLRNPS